MVLLLPSIVAARPPGTAPARSPCQSPFNERIRQDYAVLAFRAVSEFGAALLRQLDTEDVGELRRLLGVDRVRDRRLLDASGEGPAAGHTPEHARSHGPRGADLRDQGGPLVAICGGHERDSAAGHFTAACDT